MIEPRHGWPLPHVEDERFPDAVTPRDGVNRTHRLKALGNGIVPLVALPFAMAIYRMLEEG